MKRRTIGIIDYGVGNIASVQQVISILGHKSLVSHECSQLEKSDLLLLPGVGAFPAAMNTISGLGLDRFIKDQAHAGQPIIGLCLGMQLLADSSAENKSTTGLGLIPGEVLPLGNNRSHIGWNSIEVVNNRSAIAFADGEAFYFNHSYVFIPPNEYISAVASINAKSNSFPVVVERRKVLGFQFHPEKSQQSGRRLLAAIIDELCRA